MEFQEADEFYEYAESVIAGEQPLAAAAIEEISEIAIKRMTLEQLVDTIRDNTGALMFLWV